MRDTGDMDQCVNSDKPSDSCKDQLIPVLLKLFQVRAMGEKEIYSPIHLLT